MQNNGWFSDFFFFESRSEVGVPARPHSLFFFAQRSWEMPLGKIKLFMALI